MSDDNKPKNLFPDLDADNNDPEVTEIESLCMSCHEMGTTRLMLTKIPFFKEVILCSFLCEKCHFQNAEIQSAARVQEMGVRFKLTVQNSEDLNRQVVRSETASFSIPSVEFEQQASGKGEITTVEGLLDNIVNGLQALQPERKAADPETGAKVDAFIEKVEALREVNDPFTVIIDDPAGNSFVQNPLAPRKDTALVEEHYRRSAQQEKMLGLVVEEHDVIKEDEEEEEDDKKLDLTKEVVSFPANCPHCNVPCETRMKLVDIPFFKEVVLMATTCDVCGFKENEVKGAAGIEPKGKRIKLHLTDKLDLSRDVLKSDTCGVEIPELEFELVSGTLGGRFTTVEGLIVAIRDQLTGEGAGMLGDSTDPGQKTRMQEFGNTLNQIIAGEKLGIHIIIDDPAGNSYLQNTHAPDPDPEMEITMYERTEEQNEDLGLNQMKTENYC